MGSPGLFFEMLLNDQVQHFIFPISSKENMVLEVNNQGNEMSFFEVLNTSLNTTDFFI